MTETLSEKILEAVRLIQSSLQNGGKLLLMGNGVNAESVFRFERRPAGAHPRGRGQTTVNQFLYEREFGQP